MRESLRHALSTTMKGRCASFLIGIVCLLVADLSPSVGASGIDQKDVHIVYMGSSKSNVDIHNELVTSLSDRVLLTYVHGFLGFAARLTEEEAKSISDRPEVVSVFRDTFYQVHTTRSWDFLEQESTGAAATDDIVSGDASTAYGTDVIVGILDTGIWPESASFSDEGMPPIPSRWKGICMGGADFSATTCNRKLIGARYYDDASPRDTIGHGTHVASTAAGRFVSEASYYGLAGGMARGGSPNSRIAMYRVCSDGKSCLTSYILQAFEDAIYDGVDVLSVSLGSVFMDPTTDAVVIGAFHAVEKGITVVCSAGNNGPSPRSVFNAAPWILTVAATSIDRAFETEVVFRGYNKIKGGGITFSNLLRDPVYRLIDGVSARLGFNRSAARSCIPGSLDDSKVRGSILLCESLNTGSATDAFDQLHAQYDITGMIIVQERVSHTSISQELMKFGSRPLVAIDEEDRPGLLEYIRSNSNPMATILPTVATLSDKPAPVVASFSSRGPGAGGIIKPDIAAPGVDILAAWPGVLTDKKITGRELPRFALLSGTSMACPHVAGLVARVKSQHPTWGPSAILSAFVTTAITKNNLGSEITTHTGERATPYDVGAGQVSLSDSLRPGLVYETGIPGYISFMCSINYTLEQIRLIAGPYISNVSCPTTSSEMNYPSIHIPLLKRGEMRSVARVVTNVGEEESTYEAVVDSPPGLAVRVEPDRLRFTKGVQRLEFRILFRLKKRRQGPLFGSIAWVNLNDEIEVRSPYVVVTGSASRHSLEWPMITTFCILLVDIFVY